MLAGLDKRERAAEFTGRAFTVAEMRQLAEHKSLVGLQLLDCPLGDAHLEPLAALTKLVNVAISGCAITDAALAHLAKLPKLEILDLSRNKITGAGLAHFATHPKLDVLWLDETPLADAHLPLVAAIPKLTVLRIAKTRVTVKGLMLLAANPRLHVVAPQFATAELDALAAAQRHKLRAPGAVVESAAIDAAKEALLGFFAAMNKWERKDKSGAGCVALFARHCTDKPRPGHRPTAVHYSQPPEYAGERIVDAEQPTKTKVRIYTQGDDGNERRYVVVLTPDGWRVDGREDKYDGWSKTGL